MSSLPSSNSSTPTDGNAYGRVVLKALNKRYDGAKTAAVEHVDLEIEPGEFITLLGPSGCGKTTTLRMIAGFETPTSGRVFVDDVDVTNEPPNTRPMAMVFQAYALFPHMTVRQNVSYGLKNKRMSSARIKEEVDVMLTMMDLMEYADRAPHQLSGGQQQRVALARAMVMKPKVLLFDEPLSNLDAKLRVTMRTEIRRLQQRLGITSIFVTHDQIEAMTMSDRIVVMNKGLIEQVGTPEHIYRHPATVFVADFIGRANFINATVLSALSPERVKVEVLGKKLDVACAAHFDPAADITLMIRPESASVVLASADDAAGDVGRVLSAVFTGEATEYEIETDNGNFSVSVADAPANAIKVGDRVHVAFPPERSWLLNTDSSAVTVASAE